MQTVKGLELLYASVLDSQSPAELAEEFQNFQFSTNHHNMQERILTYRTYSIVPKVMLGWHNKNRTKISVIW